MRLCSCTKRMEHQPTHINTQLTTPTATLERSNPRGEHRRSILSCTKLVCFKMINVVQINHAWKHSGWTWTVQHEHLTWSHVIHNLSFLRSLHPGDAWKSEGCDNWKWRLDVIKPLYIAFTFSQNIYLPKRLKRAIPLRINDSTTAAFTILSHSLSGCHVTLASQPHCAWVTRSCMCVWGHGQCLFVLCVDRGMEKWSTPLRREMEVA